MRKIVIAATAAIFVTACSNDAAPAAKPQEETPTVLKGGEYEGSWKVASVQSVDRSTPATKLKQDASGTAEGCVEGSRGRPAAADRADRVRGVLGAIPGRALDGARDVLRALLDDRRWRLPARSRPGTFPRRALAARSDW